MADCQQLHKTVLCAFPDINKPNTDAREKFGVLHRLDIHPRTGAIMLLVQSFEKPDWSYIPPGYLLMDSSFENPACKPVDERYNSICKGDMFAFRIRANPTKKIGTTSKSDREKGKIKSNGRRVPIHGEEAQIEWITRKALQNGFEVKSVKISKDIIDAIALDEGIIHGGNSYKGKQDKITEGVKNNLSFASVTYEGRLEIVDKELFTKAITSGIGSGKAYGFGLLSIAPLR
jgi:CRISPR system Cascade subunit CasE